MKKKAAILVMIIIVIVASTVILSKVFTKDNKVLDILKWELESLDENSGCITRNLKIQTVLKE